MPSGGNSTRPSSDGEAGRGVRSRAPALATQFVIPAPPFGMIERPRLRRHLERGLDEPVTLVCAPAGSGKTSLVADGVIYLKADAQNVPAFEREQLEPFTYATKDGRRGVMSYRRMPDRLYDDPDELATWARAALAAAGRSGTGKRATKAGRKRKR